MDNIREKIEEYEKIFSQNNYNGDVSNKKSFVYKRGNIPIILSAGHCVNQTRLGKLKVADTYTGAIVCILQELTDCHILYKLNNDGVDVNYDNVEEDNGYKDFLSGVIKNNNIILLIDVHGAARWREFDLEIGTSNGYTLPQEKLNLIIEHFKSYGIHIIANTIFPASYENTVTKSIKNLTNIETFQLEINKKYRDTNDIESMILLIEALESLINKLQY